MNIMVKYVLIDMDDTLCDFFKSANYAIEKMFNQNGFPYDKDTLKVYREVCDPLWNLVEKRELIAKSDPVLAKEITELLEKAEQLEREEKELSEAMEACETVLRISEEVCQCFSEAKYYAKLDIVSGDSDDTYRKYRWLDRAEGLVARLGIHMGRLKTELCDVRVEWDTKVDISSLTAFADMWFDNIFTDIAVKKKVYKAADDAGKFLVEE